MFKFMFCQIMKENFKNKIKIDLIIIVVLATKINFNNSKVIVFSLM